MVVKMKKALYKLMNIALYGKTINITRKKTNFPSEKDHWNNFERKYILLMLHNSNHEKQVISNGKEWHYLAVKKLLAWLRGITSKHRGDFSCLNYLHSFATETKRKFHEKVCENKNFCNIDTKILGFNQ